MKKFSRQNYDRHIKDRNKSIPEGLMWDEYTRSELIIKFMPLVEHLAKKFSTTEQASGVLSILDLMQYGYFGLIRAVDKLEWAVITASDDPAKTLKSFISKRVKGAIRRAININRGTMKIPEWKIRELRHLDIPEGDYDPRVELFFAQIFESVDAFNSQTADGYNPYDISDKSEPYNIDLMNAYLLGIMRSNLTDKEYNVLRLAYGLDCPKLSAIEISNFLDMNMSTAIVRVSQIKRDAIHKLKSNVTNDQLYEI